MARTPKVDRVKDDLVAKLDSNLNLFGAVYQYARYTNDNINWTEFLHPSQANKVIGLCFMSNVSAWEEFVHASFLRYLAGATSGSGYAPSPIMGKCRNLQHAGAVLTGDVDFDPSERFLSWSSWGAVVDKAKIFFDRGEPYSKVIQAFRERVNDAFAIRNRMAHSSQKCIRDFTQVARRFLGKRMTDPLPQGFSVGKLLMGNPVRHFSRFNGDDNYYIAYDSLFRHLSALIVP